MADKLCHCSERVVSTPMEEDEPLEYASESGPQVSTSPEGAHSSREPSEYFEPPSGVVLPLQVIGEVAEEREVEDTGGEVSWKPVGTSWVHCRLWITLPAL